jgi:hypothetical protein
MITQVTEDSTRGKEPTSDTCISKSNSKAVLDSAGDTERDQRCRGKQKVIPYHEMGSYKWKDNQFHYKDNFEVPDSDSMRSLYDSLNLKS